MGRYFDRVDVKGGQARHTQQNFAQKLLRKIDRATLHYLDEKIIDHLLDSVCLEEKNVLSSLDGMLNDYSYFTAPAYKAFEGYLFQIAQDLGLPSGRKENAGSYYYDESEISDRIDSIIEELEEKSNENTKLTDIDKEDIKSRINEMKRFLKNYRHTPAHFEGVRINSPEKAIMNIHIIYAAIDHTTSVLLHAKMITTKK